MVASPLTDPDDTGALLQEVVGEEAPQSLAGPRDDDDAILVPGLALRGHASAASSRM